MKIKNTSGVDLTLPWLGSRLVLAGQVIEVADDLGMDFPAPTWELVDGKKKGDA